MVIKNYKSALAILFLQLCFASYSVADFDAVQNEDGDDFEYAVTGSEISIASEVSPPDWLLEVKGVPTAEVADIYTNGNICVRIHYGSRDANFRVRDSNEIPPRFEMRMRGSANCRGQELSQLAFEIQVEISQSTRKALGIPSESPVLTKIKADIPGVTDEQILVSDIRWSLEAKGSNGKWTLIGGLNLNDQFNGSRWLLPTNSNLRHLLVLRGDLEIPSIPEKVKPVPLRQAAEGPLELRYGVKDGQEAQGVLTADGEIWGAWKKLTVYKKLDISWSDQLVSPISLQLCKDDDCENILENFPVDERSLTLQRSTFEGIENAWLVVGWGEAEEGQKSVSPAASSEPDNNVVPAFSLAPVVAFGDYERSLTSCVGLLESGDETTEKFSLRQGRQELPVDSLLPGLVDSDVVRVVFDKARDGSPCAVDNLVLDNVTLEQLKEFDSSVGKQLLLEADAGLFVGYVQLNGADYRNSLARWRETLTFFNDIYMDGRKRKLWMDGLIYSAGERGGIRPAVEPVSNFVKALMNESSLLETAQALEVDTRVSSGFFLEQMEALKAEVGDAKVSIVYFDDYPGGCGQYSEDLSRSGLNVSDALIVSAIDGYTGRDASRSLEGGLAHVCEEATNVRVYGFNWRERLGNLDWDSALTAIADDWKR